MKNSITCITLLLCYVSARTQDPEPCAVRIAPDTTLSFFITEIKPCGFDRFIELYTCRDTAPTADRWYITGMYSGVVDSGWDGAVIPHAYTIIPAPAGLWLADAISISRRVDTAVSMMATVVYLLDDSNQSMSLCEWFRVLPPTPGGPNACMVTDVSEPLPLSDDVTVSYFLPLGQVTDELPRSGWYFIRETHRDGRVVVRKKFRAYD